jgi:hypothetical protein
MYITDSSSGHNITLAIPTHFSFGLDSFCARKWVGHAGLEPATLYLPIMSVSCQKSGGVYDTFNRIVMT